ADTYRDPSPADDLGRSYTDQIRRTHDLCTAGGRQTQFWSDVVRNYPELLDRLPGDSTVLHWGYDDRADYDGTATFVNAGLETFVCPGTSGWKRTINAMGLAERNIATIANAGVKHGATGLLNTDWGDHGHFNLLACSWHGISVGAALGWRADHPTGDTFDRSFARVTLRVDDSDAVSKLRKTSRLADRCETWRLLWMPLAQVVGDTALPAYEELTEAHQAAREARRSLERLASSVSHSDADPCDLQELFVACTFSELLVEKLIYAHGAREPRGDSDPIRDATANPRHDRASEPSVLGGSGSGQVWADRLLAATHAYTDCWHARNKPSGIDDIRRAMTAAAEDLRAGMPQ
ncbi:MAG: hypothetical protein ACYTFA_07920, partial [Planctomycetota bacterium]